MHLFESVTTLFSFSFLSWSITPLRPTRVSSSEALKEVEKRGGGDMNAKGCSGGLCRAKHYFPARRNSGVHSEKDIEENKYCVFVFHMTATNAPILKPLMIVAISDWYWNIDLSVFKRHAANWGILTLTQRNFAAPSPHDYWIPALIPSLFFPSGCIMPQRRFLGTLIPGKRLTLAQTLSLTLIGSLFPFNR